mmetsp:Transcript_90653/g.180901  ORF Transcript_90653/g.180901 Transcript_90653/m.180901 type:complete len:134 (+) Transcript_90653:1-402(+)
MAKLKALKSQKKGQAARKPALRGTGASSVDRSKRSVARAPRTVQPDLKPVPAPVIAPSVSIPPSPRKTDSRWTSSSGKSSADDEIGVVEKTKPELTAEDLAKHRTRRREAKKARIIIAKGTLENTTDLLNGWP